MPEYPVNSLTTVWREMTTVDSGENIAEMAQNQPVMLVFLRHFGCSFCRESIFDIGNIRPNIEQDGFRIVMVHMAPDAATAVKFFKRYKLYPIDHIADPERRFYRAFGLGRGSTAQLFGLMSWIRGFESTIIEGHGMNAPNEEIGDGFQMPGVFVLHKGEIKNAFIHQVSHDRPDYLKIVRCCEL